MDMKKLSFSKIVKGIETKDLLAIEGYSLDGFKYYCTNDEESGYGVIAVHHGKKLAVDTGFFDTEDFFPESDYTPTVGPDNNVDCAWKFRDK